MNVEIDTKAATWATFKGHGKPERLVFLGHDRNAPTTSGPVVRLVPSSVGYDRIDDATGEYIQWNGGSASKFWAAPVPEETPEVAHCADQIAPARVEGSDLGRLFGVKGDRAILSKLAGAASESAQPMSHNRRLDIYEAQNGRPFLTDRQARRVAKKARKWSLAL